MMLVEPATSGHVLRGRTVGGAAALGVGLQSDGFNSNVTFRIVPVNGYVP